MRRRLAVIALKDLVTRRVFVPRGQVALGTIEYVADAVVMTDKTLNPGGQASASDSGFAIRNPVPNLEFEHFALTFRQIELEGTVQRVGGLLIVVKHGILSRSRVSPATSSLR